MNLAIIGAGEQAEELYQLINTQNILNQKYQHILLVDLIANPSKNIIAEDIFFNYPTEDYQILIAMGEPRMRKKMYEKYTSHGYQFGSFIHNSAVICDKNSIKAGVIALPFVYIAPNTIIEENTLIHSGARIENNCIIGKNCFVSSGAFVGAKTTIGDNTFVGPNSSVKDSLTIGNDSIIGMSSNVLSSFSEHSVIVGNPAKFIRKNTTGKIF